MIGDGVALPSQFQRAYKRLKEAGGIDAPNTMNISRIIWK